ncbi:hypothetical protein [Chryseobacterium sp. ISL-6]|uniref:hypothetical protein n=1 Tax=Chryseobacterium sp. ISL-6 TaxID=2819143 RepID=UPI001BE564B3|nr:hypothetical protein [Chryseobacterium sp. ISL-6]MBT2622849.1 hypothetical protein [Chryseobacterium sp. ISL-6]
MVHFKIIFQCLLLSAILLSCNNKNLLEELNLNSKNSLKFENFEKQFCFDKVYKLANKTISKESEYYPLDTTQVYKLLEKNNMPIAKKFEDFVSYSTDVKFYLLQNQNQHIIIAIGKASGASGIGADYWNYLCYSVSERKELKFGSLINSPYSVFAADNNSINYVEIVDNIPRPASGEVIKLEYTPLIITVYNSESKQLSHFEMNCY